MSAPRYKRNTAWLWGLVLVALIYNTLMYFLNTLTGSHLLDGIFGVLLGLYICSKPAANAVDLIFFRRGELRQITSGWPGIGWLALNLLVLFAGWVVIFTSTTHMAFY
jgi:hypothetical protein